jgi:nucleoid-associated protein EbfC
MQEEMQREMQRIRVDASAGGGVVAVAMNGSKELIDLKIDPEAVKSGDVEMLQDLIIAAVNEASRKADEAMKGKLGSKLGGMGLPDDLL